MKCSLCEIPLETIRIASVNFDVCHSCLGVWIPNQAVKGIVAARSMNGQQFLEKILDHITKIERGAYTDKLTNLRNRRFFDRQLYAELSRARDSHNFSLILLDLDGFKSANDHYGHATGDLVLKGFAGILARLIRKNDCASRVGGDEFGIILPETDSAGALAIAKRIVAETTACDFLTVDGKPVTDRIGVSCGIASYPEDFVDVRSNDVDFLHDLLFNLADSALYAAKEHGGGQVIPASALTDEELREHANVEHASVRRVVTKPRT